jgi:hypothetical protein
MTCQISIRSPWLDLRLVVNMRILNNKPNSDPRCTAARMMLRCGISICLPLAIAYAQAAVLCGIYIAVCDLFLGQPSMEWYKVLHLLTVLCAAPWFYLYRHQVTSALQPALTVVHRYIVDVVMYRTTNGT